MRKLPLVLFDVEGGRLVKRGHSRTIRGYTLTYKLKKKGPKLKVKNLHYYGRSGKRKHLNDIGEKRTSYNRYKQPQIQQANVDILIDIETTDFVHGKGVMLKYAMISPYPNTQYNIVKYPQFTGYIKRFTEMRTGRERIFYKGQYYFKYNIYLIEIFPLNVKEHTIEPLVLEYEDVMGKMVQISSVDIKPKISPKLDEVDLIGRTYIDIFEGKGNKYRSGSPVSVLFEIKGRGMLEIFNAPDVNGLEDYLEGVSVQDQVYRPGEAQKVFEYRFKFPEKGAYSGTISVNYLDTESDEIKNISKKISLDILPGKAERKKNALKNQFKNKELITFPVWLNSKFVVVIGCIALLFIIVYIFFQHFFNACYFALINTRWASKSVNANQLTYVIFFKKILDHFSIDGEYELKKVIHTLNINKTTETELINLIDSLRQNYYQNLNNKLEISRKVFFSLFFQLYQNRYS